MNRFTKQIKLEGFGQAAQDRLTKAKVLVIGAGGLGCPAITYLAAAGVGTLGIVDHDLVDETNLHRQPLYTMDDIGKSKANIATERAKKLNPEARIITWQEQIRPENALEIIKDFDLVLDCTDNYEARYLINDACVILNKPWIYGAVEAWEGQVSVFNYQLADGSKTPTYRCIFPEADSDALSCNDVGVIGTMPGTVGIMQANEAIKAITGIGKVMNGLLLINLLTNSFHTIKIRRNEEAIAGIKALKKDYSAVCDVATDEISSETLLTNRHNYFIIDIREDYELDEHPFVMADVHIPMQSLLSNGYDFQNGKSYLLVCAKGGRSLSALRKLREARPELSFFSLKGGVLGLK